MTGRPFHSLETDGHELGGWDGVIAGRRGDAREFNLTVDYQIGRGILEGFWLRLRGAWLEETSARQNGTDFRVILRHELPSQAVSRNHRKRGMVMRVKRVRWAMRRAVALGRDLRRRRVCPMNPNHLRPSRLSTCLLLVAGLALAPLPAASKADVVWDQERVTELAILGEDEGIVEARGQQDMPHAVVPMLRVVLTGWKTWVS